MRFGMGARKFTPTPQRFYYVLHVYLEEFEG